jgi:hypothetical protein
VSTIYDQHPILVCSHKGALKTGHHIFLPTP